ncbi:hypothetical protein GCM10020358_66570 [Amorphoplanes nipponensis]
MYRVLGKSQPWVMLADVGEAYGGASALLSAAALSGIGASLFLQSRQMRQELMSLDKQRHFELVKLALENPEFVEVIDGSPLDAQDGRQKIYANLTLTYWLAMWELGEIGEAELRTLTSHMFRSGISRAWWGQVSSRWITIRGHRRRRFVQIVREEWATAEGHASLEAIPGGAESHRSRRDVTAYPRTATRWCAAVAAMAVVGVVAGRTRRRRASRHSRAGPNGRS